MSILDRLRRAPKHHDLKINPRWYASVACGEKRAEVRLDDRRYRVGDTLTVAEWSGRYTGRHVAVRVTHVLRGVRGIEPGYVVLSIERVAA